ncbi:MAG: hypothetical protein HZB40_12495 [Rhodocyclales bacterium]|nr:hypothetical protein [Rhodocyclales bacterium]
MAAYLTTVAVVFGLALAGILVDRSYRRFAARHPQLGPFRDPGKCSCCKGGDDCATTCAEPKSPIR